MDKSIICEWCGTTVVNPRRGQKYCRLKDSNCSVQANSRRRKHNTSIKKNYDSDSILSNESSKVYYVTCHIQKNGRIDLGTVLHYHPGCYTVYDKCVYSISGEVTINLKKCSKCHCTK